MSDQKLLGLESIHFYEVRILDKGRWGKENEFVHRTSRVLAENEHCLVIDDARFTTLYKDPKESRSCLTRPSISVYVSDHIWGSGVWYMLYSGSEKPASRIRAEIKAAILKKVGYFLNEVDLSIVKDAKGGGK